MFINHSSKEVTAKIVYYGPGLSGKTTCLQYIFSVTKPTSRGELISIETEIERTLFFDLLPINVGLVKGYQTKFQLYTVPGQVFYDSTRKLVLKGADGIVFVADSQKVMARQNLDSLENLKKNLAAHKLNFHEIPTVFQYNKRDLANILSPEELNKVLNPQKYPFYGSVATKGNGVVEALREISSRILRKIKMLLEQTREDTPMPTVDFDINKKHKIIEKENLPYKKIHTESLDALNPQWPSEDIEEKPLAQIKETPYEEELKVETLQEKTGELSDIMIDEEPLELEPYNDEEELKLAGPDVNLENLNTPSIPDIPEIDEMENEEEPPLKPGKAFIPGKETDVDTNEYQVMEELIEKEREKEIAQEKAGTAVAVEETEPFKDLENIRIDMDEEPDVTQIEFPYEPEEEIQDLEEIGELLEEGGAEIAKPVEKEIAPAGDPEPFKLKESDPFKLEVEEIDYDISEPPFQELEPIKKTAPAKPVPDIDKIKQTSDTRPPKPLPEFKPLVDFTKSLAKDEKPKDKKPPLPPKGLDLFEQLKDKTRLTVIKEVPVKGMGTDVRLIIDIKDKDSRLLESVNVKITPEIKKVTLILDVKK